MLQGKAFCEHKYDGASIFAFRAKTTQSKQNTGEKLNLKKKNYELKAFNEPKKFTGQRLFLVLLPINFVHSLYLILRREIYSTKGFMILK